MAKANDDRYDSLKLENQLCFPLYAAAREVMKQYRPYLDTLNLTYTQYITMMVLWERQSVSVKELGKQLCLDSGTLTPVLKNLEAKGYLLRQRATADERVLIVQLTPEGKELRERALSVPGYVANCISLSPDEAIQLYRLLYKVIDGIKDHHH